MFYMKFNENLYNLEHVDSFYKVTEKISLFKKSHHQNDIVSLGIGDVSFPIPRFVARKMTEAVKKEQSNKFIGYGNYYGLPELREEIRKNEYPEFSIDEIYVGQGTKTDVGDILEMFDKDCLIAIPNPTYPIYENSCISLSRNYELIPCDSNFVPIVPKKHFDIVFMCSPNNPVGNSYTYDELKAWVDYANKEKCIIIFDNVYFKFISSGIKSIYEINGAKSCAIELRSFSKHVSFTGIRCSYYIVPNELFVGINKYWKLRTINRFNGASYVSQIGALASFDLRCKKEIDNNINYYKDNSTLLYNAFNNLGFDVYGGTNAPYLWIKCKNGMSSWETFDLFLETLEIIIIPGTIFGNAGEGYFRVSSLGKREEIVKAIARLQMYEQKNR